MSELTPQQRAQQAAEEYTALLINSTQYSGNTEPQHRIFSVSSLGGEPLQNYLSWKYGRTDKKIYGANTHGTIYQLGCDSAVSRFDNRIINGELQEPRYQSAFRVKRVLPNGWTISGEMDHLDHNLKVIIDNKVISGTAFKEIMKNSPDHSYNLQQAGYQWLLEPTHGHYEAILSIINKGGAAIRNDIYATLHLATHPTDIIEAAFIAETDVLQFYIDNDVTPPQCDIFKYGKTKDIPNRCALYCDHNHHCPYYGDYRKERDIISRLSIV